MAKILKPRRGTSTTMNTSKASTVLASGEIFFEVPATGMGTGPGKIKMGDGYTQYSALPYFMEPTDLDTEEIVVTQDVSSTSAAALNNVSSNKSVGVLIGALKQAITLSNSELTSSITNLENDFNTKVPFKLGIAANGDYGYYKLGTNVVSPFRPDSTETYSFGSNSGSTVDLGARNNYRYVNASNVYNYGYNTGNSAGAASGYETGYNDGYNVGYNAGAASGKKVVDLGTGTSFTVTTIEVYKSFNNTNFIVETIDTWNKQVSTTAHIGNSDGGSDVNGSATTKVTITKTYNSNTGKLDAYLKYETRVAVQGSNEQVASKTAKVHAWLVY